MQPKSRLTISVCFTKPVEIERVVKLEDIRQGSPFTQADIYLAGLEARVSKLKKVE